MKLSHGDSVIVTAGKDKGKKGTVMRVLREQNRVVVSGVNMATKHVKKTTQNAGSKIQFEVSLSASNVMIVDPKTGKPTRIGYQIDPKTGAKVRVAKKSGTVLTRTKVEPQAKVAGDAPAKDKAAAGKKPGFWKNVGFGAAAATEAGTKADAGPAQSNVTHTRSAGRGS
jgi:large subunit ribosomal protein L24